MGFYVHIDGSLNARAIVDDQAGCTNISKYVASADDLNFVFNRDISYDPTRDVDIICVHICFHEATFTDENSGINHDPTLNPAFDHELFTTKDFSLNCDCFSDDGLGAISVLVDSHLAQQIR